MIDLHCHLLPGIDDGPSEMDESVALARALVADGVETVAATPHLRDDHPRVVPDELGPRCDELSARLDAEGVPLTVVSGGEVDLLWAMEASRESLAMATFGGRGTDLLLETPYGPLPERFEELLFGLGLEGFRILLAHPERNRTFQQDPTRLEALVDGGVLIQVTASSLAGKARRSPTTRLARSLVREGVAHVIASDSHSVNGFRGKLSDGVSAAAKVAPARAAWMTVDAPRAVLAGAALPTAPEQSQSGLIDRLGRLWRRWY